MKKLIVLLLLTSALMAKAQEVSVEKSVFGIQTGLLGLWAHNELRFVNSVALRTEVGVNWGFLGGSGSFYNILSPHLSLEPRFYYNLARRSAKSKDISNNSGNFISLKSGFYLGNYTLPYSDFSSNVRFLYLAPTYGIRRNIGKFFNYELGLGFGYGYYLSDILSKPLGQTYLNFHVRIGYVF